MTTAGDRSAGSIFASAGFRQFFIGQSLSYVGDGLRTLAVPLLAFHLTHSALATGTALICEVAPFSLFAVIGGSLADRIDRRRLMIGCDAVRFLVMAFFAVAYGMHFLTLPMIYGGLVVISICAAAFLGGQSTSIPYLLGRERSTEAMAALIGVENASNLITPVIGGALFAYFGPLPALAINALTYLGSQISLLRIPSLGPDQLSGGPSAREVAQDAALGFRHVLQDRGMRAQATAAFFLNFLGFGAYAILIPFLKRDFAATDQQVGIVLGLTAVGSMLGAYVAGTTAKRWPFGRAITTAYLFDAIVFIPVVLVSNIWLAALFWSLSSMAASYEVTQIIGWRMRVTPENVVGRVMGIVRLIVLAGMAPGVLLFGWIADHRGAHPAMAVAAYGYLVIAIVAFLTPAIRNEAR
jgi:MFS family permease